MLIVLLGFGLLLVGCVDDKSSENVRHDPVFGEIITSNELSGESYIHPRFGEIMKDEIVIRFNEDVEEYEAIVFIEALPAKITSNIKSINSYGVRLMSETSAEELIRIIDSIDKNTLVKSAMPNEKMGLN